MNEIERLLARDEIRQLAHRYAQAVDARDIDTLVALFVSDVRVGRDQTGSEALRADFERQLRGIGVSILFVGNHVIDFDDETAGHGVVYCKAEVQEGENWSHQAIQYHDTYEKRGNRWQFVRRKHLLWYAAHQDKNPLDQSPVDWPRGTIGRGTVPECLPTWQRFWNEDGNR